MKPILTISMLVACASSLMATEPTKEKSVSLPPPVSDKIYTFEQIEKQKAELKDKVVRIEIMKLYPGRAIVAAKAHSVTSSQILPRAGRLMARLIFPARVWRK
jgi:hypothetical protein